MYGLFYNENKLLWLLPHYKYVPNKVTVAHGSHNQRNSSPSLTWTSLRSAEPPAPSAKLPSRQCWCSRAFSPFSSNLWFLPQSLVLWPLFLRVLASVLLNIHSAHAPWPKVPQKVILPKSPPLVSTFLLSTCLICTFNLSVGMLLITSLHRSQTDSSSHLQVGTGIPNPNTSYWAPFHPCYHSLNTSPHYSEPKVPPNFLIRLHFYSFRLKRGEEHHRVCFKRWSHGPLHRLWLEPLRKQGCGNTAVVAGDNAGQRTFHFCVGHSTSLVFNDAKKGIAVSTSQRFTSWEAFCPRTSLCSR